MDYYPGQTTKFNQVNGYYTQPEYGSSPTGAKEASWVGLGGNYQGDALLQAGTTMESQSNYYAWYMIVFGTSSWEGEFPSVKVSPGDSMYALVYWTISNYPAGFEVWDWTSMTNFYVTVQTAYYDGSSAEFIDERPTVNGSYTDLATYVNIQPPYGDNIPWTNCEVFETGNSQPINFDTLPNCYLETMYDSNNLTMSQPYTPDTGSNYFKDLFYRNT
jgi:hypothetical protein